MKISVRYPSTRGAIQEMDAKIATAAGRAADATHLSVASDGKVLTTGHFVHKFTCADGDERDRLLAAFKKLGKGFEAKELPDV